MRVSIIGVAVALVSCGPKIEHSLPPWSSTLDAVALGEQGGQTIPGLPRYLPPGTPLIFEVGADDPVTLEIRSYEARREREHDFDRCGVALSGPLSLDRRISQVWQAPSFAPSEVGPVLALAEPSDVELTTAVNCEIDATYCSRVVITSGGAIGSGAFKGVARIGPDEAVGLFESRESGVLSFYRFAKSGATYALIPAPELDANPDPNRRIAGFLTENGLVVVLYEGGEIWAVARAGQIARYPTVPGAEAIADTNSIMYAVGSGRLWLVDSSTVTDLGSAPVGLSRFRATTGSRLFGIDAAGIQSWKDGVWTLELESSELARYDGGFSSEDANVCYFAGDRLLHRKSDGHWEPQSTPDDGTPLNGGIVARSGQVAFGEVGGLFFRPGAAEPWCKLMSGTSQAIISGGKLDNSFLVGTRSDNGTATIIRIDPPE